MAFTVSANIQVVKSDATTRDTLASLSKGVGSLTASTDVLLSVATGAANQAISLGGVTTAKAIVVQSDQTVTLKFNGDSTGVSLTGGGVLVLVNVSVTALTVSNASGSAANVSVYAAGV